MRLLARNAVNDPVVRRDAFGSGSVELLDDWIRQRFVYRGEIEEVLRTPRFMLQELYWQSYFEGDCDDVSTLTAAMLNVLGIPARFVAIRVDGPEFKHVYVEAWDGSDFVPIDATVERGTRYAAIERMVMDV